MGDDLKHLRLITYMCPSHPVELYVEIMNYLEETLNCHATIIYEPREPGPTLSRDPFINDTADLVFLTSAAYIKMIEENRTEHCHLLPVAPLYKHPKNHTKRPVYYSDIIIHTDVKDHVKEFIDLRGCLWAYNYEDSLSGSKIILKKLKDIGENATFFGNALKSGSHLETINMVLQKRAQAGAVDSNSLRYQRTLLHDNGKDLHVLNSLGPLPPYPILISKKIDDNMKNKITDAFLDMSKTRFWGETLAKFGIEDFVTNSYDYETTGKDIMDNVKKVGIGIRYY